MCFNVLLGMGSLHSRVIRELWFKDPWTSLMSVEINSLSDESSFFFWDF